MTTLIPFLLTTTLWGRHCYQLLFTDKAWQSINNLPEATQLICESSVCIQAVWLPESTFLDTALTHFYCKLKKWSLKCVLETPQVHETLPKSKRSKVFLKCTKNSICPFHSHSLTTYNRVFQRLCSMCCCNRFNTDPDKRILLSCLKLDIKDICKNTRQSYSDH